MEEASNLKSIGWYLSSLSNRAGESELINTEEFMRQALIAKDSLEVLISLLMQESDDSLQTDKTFREEN